jgi:hypothetical protein
VVCSVGVGASPARFCSSVRARPHGRLVRAPICSVLGFKESVCPKAGNGMKALRQARILEGVRLEYTADAERMPEAVLPFAPGLACRMIHLFLNGLAASAGAGLTYALSSGDTPTLLVACLLTSSLRQSARLELVS